MEYLLIAAAIYFFPTIVAGIRHHHNATAIFFVNLLLGWTFFGWVFAFVWSVTAPRPYERVVYVNRACTCPQWRGVHSLSCPANERNLGEF